MRGSCTGGRPRVEPLEDRAGDVHVAAGIDDLPVDVLQHRLGIVGVDLVALTRSTVPIPLAVANISTSLAISW